MRQPMTICARDRPRSAEFRGCVRSAVIALSSRASLCWTGVEVFLRRVSVSGQDWNRAKTYYTSAGVCTEEWSSITDTIRAPFCRLPPPAFIV